jgi:hypothetical protein
MDKIIFEHTKASRYAAQGGSPSGKEGYNIWITYPEDDGVAVFLGFVTIDKVYGAVRYYVEQGDEVVYTREKS